MNPYSIQKVLVGLDLKTNSAMQLLSRAVQLADTDAIEVLHVFDDTHHYNKHFSSGDFANSNALVSAITHEVDERLKQTCEAFAISNYHIVNGNVVNSIHSAANNNVDLVVVGSHGRHGWRLLLGSKPNAVLHGTQCDVLAVKVGTDDGPTAVPAYQRMLVAVDLELASYHVMEHALALTKDCQITPQICYVGDLLQSKAEKQEARDRLQRFGDDFDIAPQDCFHLEGSVAPQVQQLAKEQQSDLIVVGTHGKHGVGLVMGSTANAVLHGAHCDALSVRVH